MRKKLYLIFLILSNFCFSQSKKEKIAMLTDKIDSTINACNIKSSSLNDSIKFLQRDIILEKDKQIQLSFELQKKSEIIDDMLAHQKKRTKSLDSLISIVKENKILLLETENKFIGSYSVSYGNGMGGSSSGSLDFFSNNNGVYYFNLEYNVGAPSFNFGYLTGSFKIFGDKGVYYANLDNESITSTTEQEGTICKIIFIFDESGVFINQLSSDSACYFGFNVSVNDYFVKTNSINKRFDVSKIIPSLNTW